MAIAINGSTNVITGVGVGGLPDGIVDADMLAANAVTAGKLASGVGGKILQVKQTVKTDVFSSSSSSFVDITGMSVNITPTSTTSKILVIAQCAVSGFDAGTGIMLDRDGTEPLKANASGSKQRFTIIGAYADSGQGMRYGNPANHISFLDSPATTSQVTYKLKAKTRSSSTFYVNSTTYTNDDTNASLCTSTITVMEVAA